MQEAYLTMRILSVVLLLEIAVFVYSETCPSTMQLKPCVCKEGTDYISVGCVGRIWSKLTLEQIKTPFKILNGKTNVKIELAYIELGAVRSDLFEGIGVKSLKIENCDLSNLAFVFEEKPFTGLEDSLEDLYILNTMKSYNKMDKMKFGHLKKLRNFYLSDNSIRKMTNDWFDTGPASLDHVYIHNNGIEEMEDRVFANLSGLRGLSLIGNDIGHIERDMLPSSADRMINLILKDNALEDLPEDIFSNMPQLRIVDLQSNRIARLDQNTWESVWEQLYNTWLEGNPLRCDSRMSWLFDLRMPYYITGSCTSPKAKQGKKLKDFIDKRG